MVERHKIKNIKCDQKVNITAAFGAELALEGSTAIPNILLKIYHKIGISDFQMLLLIQLFRFYTEEKELYPSPEMLADCMEADPSRIKKELAALLEKEIIAVSEYFDSIRKVVLEGYDFEPLFLKISDIWAGIRAREIEESERLLRIIVNGRDFDHKRFDERAAGLIPVFENEFGRMLSPLEIEQIEQWAAEGDARLVVEALKQAVLRGKHNFKYINSILLGWKKNNLKTLEEIAEYDRAFQNRRAARAVRGGETGGGELADNKNNSRKKAFIKTLYM